MDFILGLPRAKRQHKSIWIIADRMMNVHFILVKVSYSPENYAKLYLKEIVKLHGVPLINITNHGTQFASQFCKPFQKGVGTDVKPSVAFYLQTDGKAEHTIKSLEYMLSTWVINFKGDLDDRFPLIEFTLNNNYHSRVVYLHLRIIIVWGVDLI